MRQLVSVVTFAMAVALLPAATMAHGVSWSCVQTDDGSQNPGPGCGPYSYDAITDSDGSNTYVLNDMWNPPGAGNPQTIYVNNPGDWEVRSDQPSGNPAVLSYPDVQQVFTTTQNTPAPLTGFLAAYSFLTESMPSNGDNEAAYDIWMGNSQSTDYAQEVMIWVDDHRTNPPPGDVVRRPTFFGAGYTVWQDPTDGGTGFYTIYMVRDRDEHSGTVHILAMLDWLIQRGLTAATGLNQIDFGWEICSTDGRPETFTISRYGIGLLCKGGGGACYSS